MEASQGLSQHVTQHPFETTPNGYPQNKQTHLLVGILGPIPILNQHPNGFLGAS